MTGRDGTDTRSIGIVIIFIRSISISIRSLFPPRIGTTPFLIIIAMSKLGR
jgi:hypothetical protein